MADTIKNEINKVAIDHWNFIEEVFKKYGEDERTLSIMRYLYVQAFIHSNKHSTEILYKILKEIYHAEPKIFSYPFIITLFEDYGLEREKLI